MNQYNLLHTLRCLYRGQTILRIQMNVGLSRETLKGRVVDVGGGRHPDYFDYLQHEDGVIVEPVDASMSGIDFEKDNLPYGDDTVDTVIFCNVLEHIYNYHFLLTEIHRMMKPGAQLIGCAPFWVCYHADPHDYFRFTKESLRRVLEDAGFVDIRLTPLGRGPLIGNFNNIVLSMPRFLRPFVFLFYDMLDRLFVRLRPASLVRNPLAFIFVANK